MKKVPRREPLSFSRDIYWNKTLFVLFGSIKYSGNAGYPSQFVCGSAPVPDTLSLYEPIRTPKWKCVLRITNLVRQPHFQLNLTLETTQQLSFLNIRTFTQHIFRIVADINAFDDNSLLDPEHSLLKFFDPLHLVFML